MKFNKQVTLLVIAVVATAMLAVGVTAAVTAGASTGATTYYGCLRSGKLIDVGVNAPSCPSTASPISWNSQGSPGPTGPQGPVGQASVVNAAAASEFAGPCPQPPAPMGSSNGSTDASAWLSIPSSTPSISGESTDPNHTGQIDLISWSFGLAGPTAGGSCSATHSPTGQGSSAQDFTIVKKADSASAKFLYFAGTGTPLGDVTLSARKAGASQDYLTITFSNTLVRGVQYLSGGDIPKEEVTFYYTKMSMSYSQQKSDGTFAPPILGCFDVSLQQAC